jgi:hypothetical protein
MLKKMSFMAVIFSALLLLSSCSITAPLAATAAPIGKKVGTAKASIIFGLCFGGDYSVQAAAKNGGITKVSTVDVKYFNVLGIFQTRTCIVTGE